MKIKDVYFSWGLMVVKVEKYDDPQFVAYHIAYAFSMFGN